VPIGIVAGLGVSALETLCNAVLWEHIAAQGILWRLVAPVIGLLLSGWVLARLHLRTVGMLNNVVVEYHHPPYTMSPKVDLLEAGACVATVGLGGSLGLGGPSQWLGARSALYLRRLVARWQPSLGISSRQILLIGAAAGVAAYFRAPLAGTILAMETPFRRDMDGTVLLPASIASLLAHYIHGRLVDPNPLVVFSNTSVHDWHGVLAVLLVGVAAGILSRRLQRGVLQIREWTGSIPWISRALLGGIVTSITAFVAWRYFGNTWTLQGGLPVAQAVFHGQFQGWAALAILALKIIAVWAALGTTGVAGVLVVTLSIGTLLGGALHPILPGLSLELACSIAVCAYLAANYNAPLTALALSVEWGGSALLLSTWPAVILAAWIGAGMANTPSKVRHRHIRPHPPTPKEGSHADH
jgi:H+/Cl- antiporter ClcA